MQIRFREAAADAAQEAQLPLVVEPRQQRPQMLSPAPRLRPAADHDVDFVDDLDLQPVSGAIVHVEAVGALR